MKKLATLAFCLAMPFGAQAATVAIGSTVAGDLGGINAQGTDVSIESNNAAYSSQLTSPYSEWVWVGDVNTVDSAVFEFTFDMTGYDTTAATLSGLWGVDNTGTVALNGNVIASLSNVVVGNFSSLSAYSTSTASFFNAGLNTLTFSLFDAGGAAAFRATAVVDADVLPPVPLPASAPLALGGLVLLAGLRRRKK